MIVKYTTLFVVLLVAASEANTKLLKSLQTLKLLKYGRTWEEGTTANVNDYVDDVISMVVPFIEANDLDPMTLPDIHESFRVKPLWVTYSASLTLSEGHMTGLVNIARSGDQKVSYLSRTLRVRLQLQFTDLNFIYRYLVKVMNIGPGGRLVGSLNRFDIVFDVLLDFNKDEIQLQDFQLTNTGRLRVSLSGNWLTDWLVTPVVNIFIRIFNSTLMGTVQTAINNILQRTISGINDNLKDTIERLESYN